MSQVVLLMVDVQAEVEMLRIDASDVKVGDVAHRAYSECYIKSCRIAARAPQRLHTIIPARRVVVFGLEPVLRGVMKLLDHHEGLRTWDISLKPRGSVADWLVKL